jgi:hypothetical protein
MASKEHKIIRRAQALADLAKLSDLLAERFNVTAPETQVTSRDSELTEIQRIESINELLTKILEAGTAGAEKRTTKAKAKDGANK